MPTNQPTLQIQQEVALLYLTMVDQYPDPAGFSFWVQGILNGQTQAEIAIGFADAPAFDGVAGMLPVAAVQQLYQNILGYSVPADDPGVIFWSNGIAGYQATGLSYREALGQIAVNIGNSALSQGLNTPGGTYVTERVANAITAGTTETATYTLTTNIDNIPGAGGSDVFNAPLGTLGGDAVNTLQAFDQISGGSGGVNTLNAVINASVTPLALSNIQVINVQNVASGPVSLGLDNATGVTSITNLQSAGALTVNNVLASATNLTVNTPTANIANTTINYVAAGPASTNLSVQGMTGQTATINGVDTVALTSAGTVANTVTINGDGDADADALAITISGATNLNLTSTSANSMTATGTNGAGYTGNLTATLSVTGTITGGTGNDLLTGSSTGSDLITGNAGNDTIVGNGGNDTLAAGEGNNSVTGGTGNDIITAGAGNDTIVTGEGSNSVTAGDGNNTITGGSGADTIDSGAGNDLITAGSGNDSITGGAGNNTVVAGGGNDYVFTTTGADVITVGSGNNTVISGGGSDTITAGNGNDNINAGGDDDRIIFAAGDYSAADTVAGGLGVNTLVAGQANLIAVDNNNNTSIQIVEFSDAMATGTFTALNVASDASVNTVVLGGGGYRATEDSADAVLNLNAGSSTVELRNLLGAGVTPTLTIDAAGAGVADVLNLNSAVGNANALNGNAITVSDYETVNLNTGNGATAQTVTILNIGATNALVLDGSNGLNAFGPITAATINASALDGTGALVMQSAAVSTTSIIGSNNADILRGQAAAATTITGGSGADEIVGGLVADRLEGGEGDDLIEGGGGNDVIRGGDGDDFILANLAGVVDINAGANDDAVDMFTSLTEGDVVDGDAGTDTLFVSGGVASANLATFVSNFEVLRLSETVAGNTQNMAVFANPNQANNWTTIEDNADNASLTFDNVGSRVTQLDTNGAATTLVVNRAVAGTSTLRVDAFNGLATVGTLDVTEEENLTIGGDLTITTVIANSAAGTLNLNSDAGNLTIGTLDASTLLTAIAISGDNNVVIDNAVFEAVNLSTITSTLSGTASLRIDASTSTTLSGVTFTGGTSTGVQTVITGNNTDVITAGSGRIDVLTLNGSDTITGSSGADTIDASGGDDIIVAGAGADSITAGTGVDSITLTVEPAGTGNDSITQGASESEAATEVNFAGAVVAVGDRMSFRNGVDVINGFTSGAGGDVLKVVNGTATSLLGASVANLTETASTFIASGTYNAVTGLFTISANGLGLDTMIIQALADSDASNNLITNQSAVILRGVDSDNLVPGNFATAGSIYTVVQNTTVNGQTNAITGDWTPATLLADGYTGISGDRLAPYTLDVDLTELGEPFGEDTTSSFTLSTGVLFTDAITDADLITYKNVSNLQFGSGSDTIITNNLDSATTVDGGAGFFFFNGVDTIELTADVLGGTINLGTSTNLVDFENIDARNAGGTITATLVNDSELYQTSAFSDSISLLGVDLDVELEVNAIAAGSGDTISITGATAGNSVNFATRGSTTADINAAGLLATLNLALGNATDNAITVTTGSAATTVSGGAAGDTLTLNADQIADGTTLRLSGASAINISSAVGNTGFRGDLAAASVTGALAVELGDAAGNTISLITGSANTTVNQTVGNNDAVTINATAMGDVDLLTVNIADGLGSVSVTGLTADLTNNGAEAVTAQLATTASITVTNNGGAVTIENGTFVRTNDLVLEGAGGFTVGVAGAQAFLGDASISGFAGDPLTFVLGNVNGVQSINSARAANINTSAYAGANDTLALSGTGLMQVTTGANAFTITTTGLMTNLRVFGEALSGGQTLTLSSSVAPDTYSGPGLTEIFLSGGNLNASGYALGNVFVDGGTVASNVTYALGAGFSLVDFQGSTLNLNDSFTKADSTADGSIVYMGISGNAALDAGTDFAGMVNMNRIDVFNFDGEDNNVTFIVNDTNYTAPSNTPDSADPFINGGTYVFAVEGNGFVGEDFIDFTGNLVFDGEDETTAGVDFEVIAGQGNDTIFGGLGDDLITAKNGNNVVFGGSGSDTITSGTGADTISGGSGIDSISAGAGNDIISGGLDRDFIDVGTGIDRVDIARFDTGDNTVGSGPTTGTVTFDIYNGMLAGDALLLGVDNIIDDDIDFGVGITVQSSTTSVAGVNDVILFTRGDYAALTNSFQASATGASTLVTFDSELNSPGFASYQSVVLVGFVGSGDNTGIGLGNVTITLT